MKKVCMAMVVHWYLSWCRVSAVSAGPYIKMSTLPAQAGAHAHSHQRQHRSTVGGAPWRQQCSANTHPAAPLPGP